jgi:hypothetical protein
LVLGGIASMLGYVLMYRISALFMVLFLIILGVSVYVERRSDEWSANHNSPSA